MTSPGQRDTGHPCHFPRRSLSPVTQPQSSSHILWDGGGGLSGEVLADPWGPSASQGRLRALGPPSPRSLPLLAERWSWGLRLLGWRGMPPFGPVLPLLWWHLTTFKLQLQLLPTASAWAGEALGTGTGSFPRVLSKAGECCASLCPSSSLTSVAGHHAFSTRLC